MPIQLVIKSPNQKFDDVLIDCELYWDVLKLKVHLSNVYPTNPKPEEQRLIYAGRLLNDHLTIKDFINFVQGQKYTLHLVCSQHTLSSPVQRSNVLPAVPNASNVENDTSQSLSNLRQRLPTSAASSDSNRGETSISPSSQHHAADHPPDGTQGVSSSDLLAQQVAAMQQFYSQYMSHFMMQQAQFPGFPMPYQTVPAGTTPIPPVTTPPPVAGQAENQGPPPEGNRARPAGNQNVRMNAQGGPLLDDEEDNVDNRDWLDWFYIFSRAFVLFAILFFYSSLERFMMVTGIAVLIYMYQGGWFGARLPQAPPPPQPPDNRENAGNAQHDNNEEAQLEQNREPVSSPESAREMGNDDQVEVQNGRDPTDRNGAPDHDGFLPHLIQTVRICLMSFFVSLIPEQPPPVNIN